MINFPNSKKQNDLILVNLYYVFLVLYKIQHLNIVSNVYSIKTLNFLNNSKIKSSRHTSKK